MVADEWCVANQGRCADKLAFAVGGGAGDKDMTGVARASGVSWW